MKKLELYFNSSKDEVVFRSRKKNIIKKHISHYNLRMKKILMNPKINIILDLGCGDGKILKMFAMQYPKKKFIGFDLSKKNIQVARKENFLPNITYIQGDAAKRINVRGKVDLIFSFSVIQYFDLENLEKLIKNSNLIIKNNTHLIHMSIPDVHFRKKMQLVFLHNNLNFRNLLLFPIRFLKEKFFNKKNKYYEFSYWYSKSKLISQYRLYFSKVICLKSDSWYRFDIVARK